MPLFEYACPNGHTEEFLERFEYKTTADCMVCGGILTRVMSTPSRAVLTKDCTGAQRH